ncbi:MAG: hypothetical protein ACYCW6_27345, partial [Candidatus Xenobia bacterium]
RLLLNRGTGLLWAMRVEAGVEPSPDWDFVRRNYYKCALALGDALLIAHGRYQPRHAGRAEKLADLADPAFCDRYQEALSFKLRPDSVPLDTPPLEALAQSWGAVYLQVEAKRTGRPWASLDAYCDSPECRETGPPDRLRNLLRNLRQGTLAWRHPREALYRQLPALLHLTRRPPRNWAAAGAAYLATWRRYNL